MMLLLDDMSNLRSVVSETFLSSKVDQLPRRQLRQHDPRRPPEPRSGQRFPGLPAEERQAERRA